MSLQVIRRVARGGMGVVDLASDEHGREYALKRLALHGTAEQMAVARARVRREADALRRIDHPAVVPLLDVLDDGDDIVLVMPFFSGGTLADRVRAGGPLQPTEIWALAERILPALTAAHRAGVLHRDVTPSNIVFAKDGQAFLTDFGIAEDREATPGLTNTGEILGTPAFLAPERAAGADATQATDVFGAGATLLYAATGEGPYGPGRPDVIVWRAAKARRLRVPKAVPPTLRHLIDEMIRVDPERRPTAAACLAGSNDTATHRRARHQRTPVLALMSVCALVGLIAGTMFVTSDRSSPDIDLATIAAPEIAAKAALCTDLPYRTCGDDPAPNTNGKQCIGSYDDYDDVVANGCEAAPDSVDGQRLTSAVSANLVPRDDTDRYPTYVGDGIDIFCDGRVTFTLAAPQGAAHQMDIIDRGKIVATGVSAGGRPVTVGLDEACGTNDARWLEVLVTSVGQPVADNYELSVRGSF